MYSYSKNIVISQLYPIKVQPKRRSHRATTILIVKCWSYASINLHRSGVVVTIVVKIALLDYSALS